MTHRYILHAWGDFACFTRPEFKVERVSYDVMTPSAARAFFECILWKRDDQKRPIFRWVIDQIDVLKPIQFMGLKRNEVTTGMSLRSKSGFIDVEKCRVQRNSLILKDVAYGIHAHMEFFPYSAVTDRIKCHEMFMRRSEKGQCFKTPYFGCREFSASFKYVHDASLLTKQPIDQEMGFMFYDWDYSPQQQARFFRASLVGGSIHVPHPDSFEVRS
jgi:CRISPR-associated protein Cas5d